MSGRGACPFVRQPVLDFRVRNAQEERAAEFLGQAAEWIELWAMDAYARRSNQSLARTVAA
jgi:hypothetical protein